MDPEARRSEIEFLTSERNRLVRRVQQIEDRLRELGVEETSLFTPPREKRSLRRSD